MLPGRPVAESVAAIARAPDDELGGVLAKPPRVMFLADSGAVSQACQSLDFRRLNEATIGPSPLAQLFVLPVDFGEAGGPAGADPRSLMVSSTDRRVFRLLRVQCRSNSSFDQLLGT